MFGGKSNHTKYIVLLRSKNKKYFSVFCSFYGRILLLALDMLEIPNQKKHHDPESIFEKMLQWYEIWTTLLRAQGIRC